MEEVAFEQYLNCPRGRANGRLSNGGPTTNKGLDVVEHRECLKPLGLRFGCLRRWG